MDPCPICLEALGDYGDPFDPFITILECGAALVPPSTVCHTFHRACLNEWRQTNPDHPHNCPTCRRYVTADEFRTARELQTKPAHVVLDVRPPPEGCCHHKGIIIYCIFGGFICLFFIVMGGFTDWVRM